jgi:LysM repeat protein
MRHRRWILATVMALALMLVAIPIASADTTYVVQPGENLFRIALRHGLTTQELAAANGIINPERIYAGQVLNIPDRSGANSAPATAPAATIASAGTYTVQWGDTLFKIAVRHGVSTQALAQANNISNPSFIYAGQRLTIPAGGSATTTATAAPSPPPAPSVNHGGSRWIDINLTTQTLTAYDGNTAVFSTLISSGTWAHPTVTGQFRIYLRYQSQDMNGYRLGYNYYLPNVPYVMYFYRDYAIHGTYWHNNFGTPMSHGCVNMATPDAQWLFGWADYGTLVNVHY